MAIIPMPFNQAQLTAAFKRSGNTLHKDIKGNVIAWIHAELVER